MNRIEIIARVKELGLVTPKPAHQCKTELLEALLAETHGVSIKKGRPVNASSNRQLRLQELEARRSSGELRRGRPVVEDSNRQIRLSLMGTLPLGRKPKPESAAYIRKVELEARRAAGTLKRGRPAAPKAE
jgi:hypothetical protein